MGIKMASEFPMASFIHGYVLGSMCGAVPVGQRYRIEVVCPDQLLIFF